MTHSTVTYLHNLTQALKKYSSHDIVQKILQETSDSDNENKSSGAFQTSLTPDVNPTTQPLRQEDEIV